MSRFIKNAIAVPGAVSVTLAAGVVTVKGPGGEVHRRLDSPHIKIEQGDDGLRVRVSDADDQKSMALAGTYWRVLAGAVLGAEKGIEKTLELRGVGYRAQVIGDEVVLQLGLSHPVRYKLPKGVSAQAPSQTELVLRGADKVLVGQTAADIRAYRPPEPYKGKGVRYRDERVIIKETKKK